MQSPGAPTSSRLGPETPSRQPLVTTALGRQGRPHGSKRWGKEATEQAGPAPEGKGGERTTGGPQPSCAHPPPSLTLLGIWEQRLRNAAQRGMRKEEAPHPTPTGAATPTPRRKVRRLRGAHPAQGLQAQPGSHAHWPGSVHVQQNTSSPPRPPRGGLGQPPGMSSALALTPGTASICLGRLFVSASRRLSGKLSSLLPCCYPGG